MYSENTLNIYNDFCRNLKEGNILYNVDYTNHWGEYLLVANIATFIFEGMKTYTALLIGLKKEGSKLTPYNLRIKFTPEHIDHIPFLKYVGRCDYQLVPKIENLELNLGLATIYGSIDLHKYTKKLSIRKPRNRKYGNDGHLIIKKASN